MYPVDIYLCWIPLLFSFPSSIQVAYPSSVPHLHLSTTDPFVYLLQ
uniref:Uncharacterized protein n=1 Tax=Arundo donax TaxID=35708 RepID=A0A0A9G5R0_ARUDO